MRFSGQGEKRDPVEDRKALAVVLESLIFSFLGRMYRDPHQLLSFLPNSCFEAEFVVFEVI